ncbi:BaiN/RdsA family NAD(P)/FAD-dependent oxidoreductase [Roseimaritima sediminicola]|uniref:NAD(P)/FAD-dependent oxidoreductase n=1 Tax=Roseimaritima sediminicola TaxID=2662066 RepID=UPI0012984B62|nr:aminoacetone oxidase family FAD-binding enzyme [Roseimaritima sediminicola]
MPDFDIAIVGAGAAGLVAAARAAERADGRRIVLLEKNRKTGAKILMSGGTRCNLTHDCDAEGILAAFGRPGRFLRQALQELTPRDTVAMFNRLGVATKVEATGKVFPQNDRAVEVRDALLADVLRRGVRLRTEAGVRELHRCADGFRLDTAAGPLSARRVIVTSGGRSWPGCGTTGDGYGWLERLGHTIEPTRPALVPLTGGAAWSRQLSGVTLDDVQLGVWQRPEAAGATAKKARRKAKPECLRRGGFLFTHQGFSGPAVMDVSRELTIPKGPEQRRLRADFLPDTSDGQLLDWLTAQRQRAGGQNVAGLLAQRLPRRLAAELVQQAAGDAAAQPLAGHSDAALRRLVESVKRCELHVHGSRGFEKAEVTAGGVRLSEVDPRTMQSRLVPGLYIAGEILDLDGWIGGYNFQSAFSTGHVAGSAAGEMEI